MSLKLRNELDPGTNLDHNLYEGLKGGLLDGIQKDFNPETAAEYRQILERNVALIRSGEDPIRFSIKRRVAKDVAKGKGDV